MGYTLSTLTSSNNVIPGPLGVSDDYIRAYPKNYLSK